MKYRTWFFGLLLVLGTLAAYLPALRGQFVWDDACWTSDIPDLLKDFSGLRMMWCNLTALQQYYPLTGTTFWIDHQLWGTWTLPYHLENVLLHTAAALLFWRLLRRLGTPGAWLAAALFALHPVMVESAAWITERKNVLSLALYLGALLAYGRFARFWVQDKDTPAPGADNAVSCRYISYGLALLLFLAALLSKTTAFSFPAVVLLICWWKRGRLRWRQDVLPSLPFFALSISFSMLTAWLEKNHVMAQGPEFALSIPERCVLAGRVFWFYAVKLLWPAHLCFVYPRWHLDAGSWIQWICPVTALGLFLVLWSARKRIGRGPIAAALFFAGTLFPVLGFMNAYFMVLSFVWDHCVYLSSLGLLALGAALVVRGADRLRAPWTVFGFATVILPLLAILTWRQCRMYADYDTLILAALAKNPGSSLSHDNLAGRLLAKGQVDEAIEHFHKSLESRPYGAFAHNGLGVALVRKGRIDEALLHFEKALEISPNNPMANFNTGNLLLQKGQVDEAIEHYQRSLAIEPDDAQTHAGIGAAFLRKGVLDEAIAHLEKALTLQPEQAEARYNLGNAFLRSKHLDAAIAQYRQCLAIDPNNAGAEGNLGNAFILKGRLDDAIVHFQKALKLRPGNAEVHYNLGNALFRKRQLKEAVLHFETALQSEPNNTHLLNSLARILATSPDASIRNGARAVELMQRADQLSNGTNPWVLTTLAAAYGEAGRFPEAVAAAGRALELAVAQTNSALADTLQTQTGLYREGRPFRDAP